MESNIGVTVPLLLLPAPTPLSILGRAHHRNLLHHFNAECQRAPFTGPSIEISDAENADFTRSDVHLTSQRLNSFFRDDLFWCVSTYYQQVVARGV